MGTSIDHLWRRRGWGRSLLRPGAPRRGANVLAPLVVVPFPRPWFVLLQRRSSNPFQKGLLFLAAPTPKPPGAGACQPGCPVQNGGVVWWPFPFLVVRWPFPFLPVERQQGTLPWVLLHKLPILLPSRPRENTQHSTYRAIFFVYIRRPTRSNDRYLGHRNHITHHHHQLHSRSTTSIISFYYMAMDD